MPTIDTEGLELSLLKRVQAILTSAALPTSLPWTPDAQIEDLARTGSCMDRFNDGKYRVTYGCVNFIIDGGATVSKCDLRWKVIVDTQDGIVLAKPVMSGKVLERKGTISTEVLSRLGFQVRKICMLGRLEQLLPYGTELIRTRFRIKPVWGLESEVKQAREELVRALAQ